MKSADAAMARLAESQHGLVTVDQLHAQGVSRKIIARRVVNGQWTKLSGGVFRIAGAPVTWESTVLAHLLAAGRGATASHRTAAVLWGLDGVRQGIPELTVPRHRRYVSPGVRVHRSTDLHLVRPVLRSGIPTTPVSRTLLDLGAVLPLRQVHLAVDDARRRRLTNWDLLLDALVDHARRGRDGIGTLRAIVDEHRTEVAATGSGFERLVVILLRDAGLPTPVLQHEVTIADRTYRPDLAYPDVKLAIELDGSIHLKHHVWQADHVRQNALVLAGWTILRFTWHDYVARPGDIVSEVRAALVAA